MSHSRPAARGAALASGAKRTPAARPRLSGGILRFGPDRRHRLRAPHGSAEHSCRLYLDLKHLCTNREKERISRQRQDPVRAHLNSLFERARRPPTRLARTTPLECVTLTTVLSYNNSYMTLLSNGCVSADRPQRPAARAGAVLRPCNDRDYDPCSAFGGHTRPGPGRTIPPGRLTPLRTRVREAGGYPV
jgi:hypothetical protein